MNIIKFSKLPSAYVVKRLICYLPQPKIAKHTGVILSIDDESNLPERTYPAATSSVAKVARHTVGCEMKPSFVSSWLRAQSSCKKR